MATTVDQLGPERYRSAVYAVDPDAPELYVLGWCAAITWALDRVDALAGESVDELLSRQIGLFDLGEVDR